MQKSLHNLRDTARPCTTLISNVVKGLERERYLFRPSKLAQELVLASYGTPALSTTVSGSIIGLKDKV